MVLFDNIVEVISPAGGVSVLFSEMLQRLEYRQVPYRVIDVRSGPYRVFERYRKCKVDEFGSVDGTVFHSTYYRRPSVKVPMVTTVHDFTYERTVKGLRRIVHSLQKNDSILNSDMIICVSQSTKNDLAEFVPRVDHSKVRVIYNGVSDKYKPLNDIKLKDSVLFVGGRSGYKNFKSLVIALSMINNIRLECIGGGMFTKDELLLLRHYLPGRFFHLRYVTNSELNVLYNEAICLVYPSQYEGFGIPILEAMRSGCPVVATNCSSIPEVAGDAAYLTDFGLPDEICAAIRYFLVAENRSLHMTKGFDQAKKFSWDATFASTLEVYNELGADLARCDR